jgi:ribulose-5-phosphate 4-epimerase/fuculose-1-phosphate aldolase
MSFDHSLARRRVANEPISEAEWKVRVDLAACYRLAAREGWDDLIYTHISARVPGPEHHFLINPFGMSFDEITASSLVKIDLEGSIVGDSAYGVNKAGFVIHSAVHEARPQVGCVMHTHTENGMAVSMLKGGFRPVSQHAMMFHDRLGYHDYEGLALEADEKARLVRDLGNHGSMILRNHGFLTTGGTVGEAFVRMFYLEKAAGAQLKAMASGDELVVPPPEVCEKTARQFDGDKVPCGTREWPAMLRRLDRADPSYRN